MLGFDLQFARDAVTLSCRTCGEQQDVDRTHSPQEVAAATVLFCDTHVPCTASASIPAPRAASVIHLPAEQPSGQ